MTKRRGFILGAVCLCLLNVQAQSKQGKKEKPPQLSPVEKYVQESLSAEQAARSTAGSIYRDDGLLSDISRDLRARNVNDLVTILVTERATAVSSGNSKTTRQSSAKAAVSAAGGPLRASGPWPNLASTSSQSALDGQGTTSRQTAIVASLSARVVQVLPNGYLVLDGTKEVQVNSEKQLINVRGVARWNDVTPTNTIGSDRLAQMEVRINGKGIVGDAIRRPNILYRILLGILPF